MVGMHRNENSGPKQRIMDVLENQNRKCFVIIIYLIKYYKVIM